MDQFTDIRRNWRRIFAILLSIFLLIGIVNCILLTYVHYKAVHAQGGGYKSFCSVSEKVDCVSVTLSPWSRIAGLPISVLGMVYYIALLFLAFRGTNGTPFDYARALSLTVLGGILSILYSLYLWYISTYIIKVLCPMCYILYFLNPLVFLIGVVFSIQARLNPIRVVIFEIKTILDTPKVAWGLVGLLIVLIAGGIALVHIRRELMIRRDPYLSGIFDGTGERHKALVAGIPSKGPLDARIAIIEFNDFQCPFCRDSVRTLEKISMQYPGKIRQLFVNLPGDARCNPLADQTLHPGSCRLAYAGRLAYIHDLRNQTDLFWNFHEIVFKAHRNWTLPEILETLEFLGLDREKSEEALSDAEAVAETLMANEPPPPGRDRSVLISVLKEITELAFPILEMPVTPSFLIGTQRIGRISEQGEFVPFPHGELPETIDSRTATLVEGVVLTGAVEEWLCKRVIQYWLSVGENETSMEGSPNDSPGTELREEGPAIP